MFIYPYPGCTGPHFIIPLASTKLKGGYTGFTLSVCPSACLSVDRIMSALYLQQYSSDPFHIWTSDQATSEGVLRAMFVSKFWQILEICNFDFVFFWLGIQYDSMVWVIIRWQGVSSERRHSSCSSWWRKGPDINDDNLWLECACHKWNWWYSLFQFYLMRFFLSPEWNIVTLIYGWRTTQRWRDQPGNGN